MTRPLAPDTSPAVAAAPPPAAPTLSATAPSAANSPDPERSVTADLAEVLSDFWNYRELLLQLTRRDIRIRYKQAVMGFGWAVFMPILVVLAGVLVRAAMAHLSHSTLDVQHIAGLAVKALPWSFFVGAIGFATASLVGNTNLVTKIYFPREVLPISATLAQAFDTAIGTVAVALILPFLGVRPTFALLWVPVLAVLTFVFTAGTSLFLGCANLFFRDVKYIVQVLLTFGIFFTPVFFEPAMFGPTGARLMMLNPLSPMLEGLRLAVVGGHNLLLPLVETGSAGREILVWSPWYLLYGALWGVAGLLASALLFHRLEFKFAEYI
ncbi:MAG TPA: ABC transporter permease [Gemmatimonadales bacterium]|nr:ABC transporter permease [Gemmatimonadales bacterium]